MGATKNLESGDFINLLIYITTDLQKNAPNLLRFGTPFVCGHDSRDYFVRKVRTKAELLYLLRSIEPIQSLIIRSFLLRGYWA